MSSSPKTITLGTGEAVHFKLYISHKADMTFERAKAKDRKADGTLDEAVWKAAMDEAFPLLIDFIDSKGSTMKCTQEWLDDLPIEDHNKLVDVFIEMIAETKKKIDEAKKKGGGS